VKRWLRDALGLREEDLPFPWQEDLLDCFRRGEIPPALDIPTGLGKTKAMAIWLVARAGGAPLPRRLVYVVDRRAVVDQATTEAVQLRDWVERSEDVKRALGLDRALPISTLRGQHVDNREWLDDPSSPAIIVGTVDMLGSRLLFEGYGVSRKMRPYHAGLLGADTLVVLNEAHLLPPFEYLLRSIATKPALGRPEERWKSRVLAFRLLALSATGPTPGHGVIGLTERDLSDEVVTNRLNAKKSLRTEALDGTTRLEQALAKEPWALTDNGRKAVRVLVYADSREVAWNAKKVVEKIAMGERKAGKPTVQTQTDLLVGGQRVFEREAARRKFPSLGFIAGSKFERSGPVFLFATPAGEVRVKVDADHMVCDLVPPERMVQRPCCVAVSTMGL
jgi:CRISPR-associated endonuclease/helicase Cas3